jgi:hypothetical protein
MKRSTLWERVRGYSYHIAIVPLPRTASFACFASEIAIDISILLYGIHKNPTRNRIDDSVSRDNVEGSSLRKDHYYHWLKNQIGMCAKPNLGTGLDIFICSFVTLPDFILCAFPILHNVSDFVYNSDMEQSTGCRDIKISSGAFSTLIAAETWKKAVLKYQSPRLCTAGLLN